MSVLLCSFCGYDKPPFEMHHIASRHNHPHWTVRACAQCHHMADAWNYADRLVQRGRVNKEPQTKQEQHEIMVLALSRCGELLAHSSGLPKYTLLLAALAEIHKQDSTIPAPHYKNPAPVPKPLTHQTERVVAAHCAIFAYFMEEWLGADHPLPALMRKIELEPLVWRFDNTPGLSTFDFTSETSIRGSMLTKLYSLASNGIDEMVTDYMGRWHRI